MRILGILYILFLSAPALADDGTRWFLLNAADVPSATADSSTYHKQKSGGAELSVVWNIAHTQALVKVTGADKQWQSGKGWASNAVAEYDRSTHAKIFEWFYSPEWQPKEK